MLSLVLRGPRGLRPRFGLWHLLHAPVWVLVVVVAVAVVAAVALSRRGD